MADKSDIEKYTPRYNLIVQMTAAGMHAKDIAAELEMAVSSVHLALSKPTIKRKIKEAQERYWGKGIRKRMETIATKALDQIETLMDDPTAKCSTRLAASIYIVDQAVGKAQQTVNVQSSVIGDLLTKLDSMGARAVAPILELAASKDAIDTFVDELVPDVVTVGVKRGASEADEAGGVSDGIVEAFNDDEGDSI